MSDDYAAALHNYVLHIARMSTFEDWVNEQTRSMTEEEGLLFESNADYTDTDLTDAKATLDSLIYTARKLTRVV